MLDQGSRVGLVKVHETAPKNARLGNTSANEVNTTLTGGWFKFFTENLKGFAQTQRAASKRFRYRAGLRLRA